MEASIFSLRWFPFVAFYVILKVLLGWDLASVSDREIVILQIVVVLLRLWLTI